MPHYYVKGDKRVNGGDLLDQPFILCIHFCRVVSKNRRNRPSKPIAENQSVAKTMWKT